MRDVVSRVHDLYARAAALGLSEGQAHHLAEILASIPGSRIEFDDGLLTVVRPGAPGVCLASTSLKARMPFEGATSLERDLE